MKLNINDEQGIELLYFIFERELKPPFNISKSMDFIGYFPCYNKTNKFVGRINDNNQFYFISNSFIKNIKSKICQTFEFFTNTDDWWIATQPHLKSWLESHLNTELNDIFQ